jgi:putative intracellular protease/amidase
MTGEADRDTKRVDLSEAARQLQQAGHDVRVAFDCLGLDDLDGAHTHTITARAAVDAAEYALRVALGGDWSIAGR